MKPTQMGWLALVFAFLATNALGQGTSFTYQGRLTDTGNPANGQYDFQFKLYDTETVGTGTQQGGTVSVPNVTVTAGMFTVQLDFGASAFPGADRFLEIGVVVSGGSPTTLSPRQQLRSSPYAIRSASAGSADTAANAIQLNGVAAGQYVLTTDSRLTDARPPTSGSANYIQNAPPSTQSASFLISGNGTAQGTLSGNVVNATTQFNLGGSRILSGPGSQNLLFGSSTGLNFSSGTGNTFLGAGADFNVASGTGNQNIALGNLASVQSGRTNATAIGSRAQVTQDNVIVLGSINGVNGAIAGTRVGIGMTNALYHLDVLDPSFLGLRVRSNQAGGTVASFGANGDFAIDSGGSAGGRFIVKENGNVGIGTSSPQRTLQIGSDLNSITVSPTDGSPNAGYIRFGDNTGWKIHVARSRESSGGGLNTNLVGQLVTIQDNGMVGIGTFQPRDRLEVNGDIRAGCLKNFSGSPIVGTCSSDARLKRDIRPFPKLLDKLATLQPVHFYWDAQHFPERGFGEEEAVGLVAQEVEKVMPELVTEDKEGYKMVRYEELPLLMLEAIKELKEENDLYRKQLREGEAIAEQQQRAIAGLMKLVCKDHPAAEICK